MASSGNRSPLAARRRRILRLAIAICALEVAAFVVATRTVRSGEPATVLADVVYPLLEVVAVVALVVASRRAAETRERRFFGLVAASTILGLGGDVARAILDLGLHEAPSPSVADALYVGGLALLVPALIIAFGSPLRRWRELIDVSIGFCALVFAGLTWLIEPELERGLSGARIVAVAESSLAVVSAITAIAALRATPVKPPASVRLVAAAVAVQASSWLVWTYLVQVHGVVDITWILTGWQATWSLLVLGALSSIVGGPQELERERRRPDDASPRLVMAGLVLVLGVLGVDSRGGRLDVGALAFGVAVVVIVVLRLQVVTRERGLLARSMRVLASTDKLTGVPNRRLFDERLDAAVAAAPAGGGPLGLLLLDVDRFKRLNDSYGHPVGDEVLRQVAARLAGAVRGDDLVARIGGEEFAVVAPGTTPEALAALAERCRQAVGGEPFAVATVRIPMTISAGGACLPVHARTRDELMRVADRALYRARETGRDRVHVGPGSALLESLPMMQSSVVDHLERLADQLDGEQAAQAHSAAMLQLAARLCERLGLTVAERRRCLAAARLHDVGKVGTPLSILRKPAALTPEELAIMRDHVRVGVELLASSPETRELAPIVAEHHEPFDGSGYPAGKRGLVITIEARIIAVADAFTAMLADRPYRAARTLDEARRELRRCSGAQFDPRVVTALLAALDDDAEESSRDVA
jgi:diguanylate cyclase (GGDEF)-like protein/putative nucleotidyltransferase with HDIG domain